MRHHVILVALVLASLFGCATKRDVVVSKLRGRGAGHVYPVTTDQAWSISKAILRLEPTDSIEEHRSEGYMLTNDTITALVPSTFMGVFIEPAGANAAKVTFVTRRRTPTQAYAALTEGGFHRKFAELLGLVAAVGPMVSGPDGGASERPSACPTSLDSGTPGIAPDGGTDGASGVAAP
jgi:hypothetical protein